MELATVRGRRAGHPLIAEPSEKPLRKAAEHRRQPTDATVDDYESGSVSSMGSFGP